MSEPTESAGLGLSLAKRIILLFEGDRKLADHWEKVITHAGYVVKSSEKVEKKLYPAIAQAAKVFVWDSDSPPFSLEELRAAVARKKETPVIVLTGSYRIDTRIEELGLGTYDYLRKPFTDRELLEAIRSAMKKVAYAEEHGHLPQPASAAPAAPPEQKLVSDAETASGTKTVPGDSSLKKPLEKSVLALIPAHIYWIWTAMLGACAALVFLPATYSAARTFIGYLLVASMPLSGILAWRDTFRILRGK